MRKKPELSLRARALQYLARREYSRAELRGKLLPYARTDGESGQPQPEGPRPENLDALLDDLTACGWLSDARAATQLLHAKRSRFGTQRIAQELRRKGIAEELIGDVLPGLKETELDAARNVWQKKFGALPQDEKEKARQVRFLQSRGFSMDTIFKVVSAPHSAED
ncbi:MAG: recombination regulator RecX [Gallionellales bacterium RIFCSPLOWO2_12_FULL_59_22]|nr:MAG: recombination regulator RecX [Gallionellales bacterium RIFCSPLOWO2_02_FULL_59_110]OGT01943.1 MAG: recombination regulator RecX [Gallionellales bacterium RIFCSPLOWO2_02_58_13]OGT10968.1 MAG: recombination regulator RecX [Gallionellales bacterium RIFCSPLOWO2_12_FULL_59_22]